MLRPRKMLPALRTRGSRAKGPPSGKLVFNEVNTIPGLTVHSRFPKMLEAAGIPLEDTVTQAIEEALEP